MKPVLMRHTETTNESFNAWANFNPYMHNPWHYQAESELTFIDEGRGILFEGESVTTNCKI